MFTIKLLANNELGCQALSTINQYVRINKYNITQCLYSNIFTYLQIYEVAHIFKSSVPANA